jgi:oxalate decarboxylase
MLRPMTLYDVKGRARVTIFRSHGRVRTDELGPGHVACVGQGYGHFVEQLVEKTTQILVLFASGVYEEISLSNWLGGNPNSILTTNFGIGNDLLDGLPKSEKGILSRRG